MYQLNFPNGNVQTYNNYNDLLRAARDFGGEAKIISGKIYAFVPKKQLIKAGRNVGLFCFASGILKNW